MTQQGLTIPQFRLASLMNRISRVHMTAHGDGFVIGGMLRGGTPVVLVRRADKQPRVFVKPFTAIKLLHDMGVESLKLELSDWEPGQ